MNRIIILISLICLSLNAAAQQDAIYSQYMFNKLAINPAYAGSREVFNATAMYRNQWVGIKGAPKIKTISVDGALRNEKLGIGFQTFNYKMGVSSLTGGFTSYSYRIFFPNSTLAFGLQAGATNLKSDLTSVKLGEQVPDEAFLQNINEVFLNFGAGVYFTTERFFLGLASPHLLKNRLRDMDPGSPDGQFTTQDLHIFLTSGYMFDLGGEFILKPSFLVKQIQGSPIQVDLNANLYITEVFAIGAQYRNNTAIAGMLELQLTPNVRMGYSYDKSITRLTQFNSGSHEIMLRFKFDSKKANLFYPRYF